MSRELVLLFEDRQHESFANRFLKEEGWRNDQIHRILCGSYTVLIKQFPGQLHSCRVRSSKGRCCLIVIMDDDTIGAERKKLLDQACKENGIPPPMPADPLALFIPSRNIETWIEYLRGSDVDEVSEYPKLKGRESACHEQVASLRKMCQRGQLRAPAPGSLTMACGEYEKLRRFWL